MAFVLFEGTRRVMSWRLKREAMGFGDVKLMTAGGIWVGAQALPLSIIIGCCAAALALIIFSVTKKVNLREHILPFGPFLAFGLIAAKYFDFIFAW
jgi:leader peptidase (prepilin peptidase)/N-methyltransferase